MPSPHGRCAVRAIEIAGTSFECNRSTIVRSAECQPSPVGELLRIEHIAFERSLFLELRSYPVNLPDIACHGEQFAILCLV